MQNPSRRRSFKGWVLLVTGLLTCPCHLPLIAAALAGTAGAAFLREYIGLILPLTALYFIVALIVGIKLLTPAKARQGAESTPGASGDARPLPTPEVPRRSRAAGIKQ